MEIEQEAAAGGAVRGRRSWKKLSPQEKWRIFQETSAKDAPVGEILRQYGLYSSELTKIRRQVEAGALKELGKNRQAKRAQHVPHAEYEKLKAELSGKEKALAQMSEEYLLLKKKMD